ncbi:hypothetical protein B296_00004966 [Ensete ventricosum]|uniref:Uncharacterized protein n=1 Tax=Ensete ventricosum TaxID=4639 RepID=A0A427B8H1_ENSVE|nr:hypothetical protein B296_00004966 [Ensete ventricosum]
MMGEPEDERLRTVDCLRGRLLAERVASKAAKEEAESLAKRVCWNRAEKRLELALKKLEALKDARSQSTLQDSSSSSSSSLCFLSPQRLEQEKPGALSTADSQQFGSMQVARETLRSSSSEDLLGDNVSGTGSDAEPETAIHQAESEDRMLAIVPASVQLNLEACRPEVKEVQGVLDALRNIKVQLLYAMGVLVSHGNSRGAAFCCQRNQVKMPVAVKEWYNAR